MTISFITSPHRQLNSCIQITKAAGQTTSRSLQIKTQSPIGSGRHLDKLFLFFLVRVVHEQVLLPLRTRFSVVTKQYVIESQPKQLLRRQQRHSGLFRRAVTLSLIAFYAGSDKVCRGAFAALGTRQDVIKRQILSVPMLAAILAPIAVADVNPCPLHCRLASVSTNVDVVSQADHGRDLKNCRRGTEYVIAVVLFDKDRAAKPQANRSGNTDGAQRLIRKVQKQNSSCKQTPIPPIFFGH